MNLTLMKNSVKACTEMGFPILILVPNEKIPLTRHGCKDATTDISVLERLIDNTLECNLGIATGFSLNGRFLTVIDVDAHKDGISGHKSLEEFEEIHGKLPETVESRTPNDGKHLWFWTNRPYKNRVNVIPGVDIRGEAGYIVAPPSVINGKEYKWIKSPFTHEIADANDAVYTLLEGKSQTNSRGTLVPRDGIPEGQRTDTLMKALGSMQAKGLSDEAIRAAIIAENESRCNPPLSEQELEKTVFPALSRWQKGTASYERGRDYTENTAHILSALLELHPEKNGRYGWHDAGNGNLFSDLSKTVSRYVPERKKWYCYDGTRWNPDVGNTAAMNYCKSIADALITYTVQNITDEKLRTDYLKHVSKWQGYKYRETILKDAATVAPVSVSDFDSDKYLFNVANGTLNLRNGDFKDHNPNDLITKLANVEYHPEATCARWEQFIFEISCGDTALAEYIQKAFGYALTGDTKHECFFILYGATSRNGKGTLCDTFATMIGDYGKTASPETIAQRKYSDSRSPSEDVARLAGARYVGMSEPDKKMILSASLVKTLTGNDTVNARFLGENSFEYKPQFKMFISTNHLPYATDSTLFSSDRVKVIPFNKHFGEGERDESLKQKLSKADNLSGILNWCIAGLHRLNADGFTIPQSVREATQDYSANSDKVGQFIDDFLTPSPDAEIKAEIVHKAYQEWCYANGFRPEGYSEFKKSLASAGIEVKRARPKEANSHNGNKAQLIYGYSCKNP